MHRRVDITLPEETIRTLDRVARKGDPSFQLFGGRRIRNTHPGKPGSW
jgi:hypothetical protein